MSGHSKWANIRVRKGAQDAKRNKVFTRHARLIEIAARAGGGDPVTNTSLRTAIDNAKEDSVPNANIERAIKKGSGELKGEAMQELVYEAYGPGGTAYLIECLSDNRNRTAPNIRLVIGKHGGRVADSGSVAWMFDRKGLVVADIGASGADGRDVRIARPYENLELELIDFGAEDFTEADGVIRVVTALTEWTHVRDFLKAQNGCTILSAGLSYLPKQRVPVDEVTAQKVAEFMEAIEEDDDVSEVHTNADL